MKNVNLKPKPANKLLQSLMLPFALKAGTIGKLEVKVTLFKAANFVLLGESHADVGRDGQPRSGCG